MAKPEFKYTPYDITDKDVLYEDNHLIAVNKRAGDIVQVDDTGDEPLDEKVKKYIAKKYNKPNGAFLGVVHRLDRPVSGVILFAKTSKALERINLMFKSREMHKTYYAVVRKRPESGRFVPATLEPVGEPVRTAGVPIKHVEPVVEHRDTLMCRVTVRHCAAEAVQRARDRGDRRHGDRDVARGEWRLLLRAVDGDHAVPRAVRGQHDRHRMMHRARLHDFAVVTRAQQPASAHEPVRRQHERPALQPGPLQQRQAGVLVQVLPVDVRQVRDGAVDERVTR